MSQLSQEPARMSMLVLPSHHDGNSYAGAIAQDLRGLFHAPWFSADAIMMPPPDRQIACGVWRDVSSFARTVGAALDELIYCRPDDFLGIVVANGQREPDSPREGTATWLSGLSEPALLALEMHHRAVPMGLLNEPEMISPKKLDPRSTIGNRSARLSDLRLPVLGSLAAAPGLALQFNPKNLRREK